MSHNFKKKEPANNDFNDEFAPDFMMSDFEEQTKEKKQKPKKSRSGVSKVLVISVLLLIAVIGGAIAWVMMSGEEENVILTADNQKIVIDNSVTYTDLSGKQFNDFSFLPSFSRLEGINLSNSNVTSLSVFDGCSQLKKVELAGSQFDANECAVFYEKHPNAKLICDVNISGSVYSSDIEELELENNSVSDIKEIAVLRNLKSLKLDSWESLADEDMDYLYEKLPNCHILYKANIFGKELLTDVSLIDIRGKKLTFDAAKESFDKYISRFYNLTKVDMCYCGLTNEQMDELNKTYEGVKFVWMVSVANGRWMVRSDAKVFATLTEARDMSRSYEDKDFAPLYTYCKDLVALDVGHTHNKNISLMSNLTHLRAIICMDNRITDISAFANMPNLEFIEANASNRIKSVEPLRNLQNLKYINLYSNKPITDLTPLYNHEKLSICIFHPTVPNDQRKGFMESNPNCKTFFSADTNKNLSTNDTWRKNPYRKTLKVAFKNWQNVVDFDEATGKYIFDENTDQYKKFK